VSEVLKANTGAGLRKLQGVIAAFQVLRLVDFSPRLGSRRYATKTLFLMPPSSADFEAFSAVVPALYGTSFRSEAVDG
jgi:hypothetical protein